MYLAICHFDTLQLMESALGRNVDDDFVSATVAAVSWLHLCWVCNEMRTHFYGLIYLMFHISYMCGYVSGVHTYDCALNSTLISNHTRLIKEYDGYPLDLCQYRIFPAGPDEYVHNDCFG